MTIRRKLIILLLSISLLPLMAIVFLNRLTITLIGDQLSSDIQIIMEDNATYAMQNMIDNYDQQLRTNIQLMQAIIELQAAAIEKALRQGRTENPPHDKSSFAPDDRLAEIPFPEDKYFYVDQQGNKHNIQVSFSRQNYFIARHADRNQALKDMSAMQEMTDEYHRLYLMLPDLIYWLHTSFEDGLHLTYPSGGKLPENYDHRQRQWYVDAKKVKELSFSSPYIDASTHNPVMTLSKPFTYPDGRLAGVTSLDFDLTDLFQWIHFNPRWAAGAEAMLVTRVRKESGEDLEILARMNYHELKQGWDRPLGLESLSSVDTTEFESFKEDMLSGVSGIRIMDYKGNKSVWAYRGFAGKQVYPLVIVPYKNFQQIVADTEDVLWNKNLQFMRYTAFLAVLVITMVIIISIRRAKFFTEPINNLADAGIRLANGDFDASVNIGTGDELQQLGDIFNSIGPKLREHEKMQQSLEIARVIQQRLLPKKAPQSENFDLAGLCKYSDETGGDYYDFIAFDEIEPGKISVILGDVTGHGIGAALLMASARSMLRNNIRHYAYDLSRILAEFNNELVGDTDPDKFITLFYGLLDDKNKKITWATGGHDPAFWLQAKTDKIKYLESDGVPLGFVPDMVFEQAGPASLNPGDVIVIGTDGIWEAENEKEEMFGKERLVNVIRENQYKSAAEICQTVVDEVRAYCQPLAQDDDITIIVIKVK